MTKFFLSWGHAPPPMWNSQNRIQRPLFHVVGYLETKFQEDQMKDVVGIASQNKFPKKWRKIFRTFDPPPIKGEISQNLSRVIWPMLLATLKPNFGKIERKMWFTQLPKLRFAKNDENFSDFWSPPPLKKWNSQNCLERDLDHTVGYLETEFP